MLRLATSKIRFSPPPNAPEAIDAPPPTTRTRATAQRVLLAAPILLLLAVILLLIDQPWIWSMYAPSYFRSEKSTLQQPVVICPYPADLNNLANHRCFSSHH
jgi:hypothetical protein